ncbi:MAG: serine hydrolase domain-containing protein [Planctomycetales bacterium]
MVRPRARDFLQLELDEYTMLPVRLRFCAVFTCLWLPLAAERLFADETPPVAGGSETDVEGDDRINALLTPVLEKHKTPGLVAGIVRGDRLWVAGAVGVRKSGSPEPMTVHDQLHLGSDTKAMTATLLALLVEEGKLRWDSTVGELFPDLADQLHPDCRGITLTQLIQHRAGLVPNGPYGDLGEGSLVEKREALLVKQLGKPPTSPPGTKFVYSNLGYIVAGHMAEQVAGDAWEHLMTTRLFEPLGMKSAGFGAPGTRGEVDQPWGHALTLGIIQQSIQGDNPPVLGPAGTVHCSLADWSRFVGLHLQGAQRMPRLLTKETFQFLHTPAEGFAYAGGWGVVERPEKGRLLAHSGSNTMWYATAILVPEKNLAFLAVTNQGGNAAQAACDEAIAALAKFAEPEAEK